MADNVAAGGNGAAALDWLESEECLQDAYKLRREARDNAAQAQAGVASLRKQAQSLLNMGMGEADLKSAFAVRTSAAHAARGTAQEAWNEVKELANAQAWEKAWALGNQAYAYAVQVSVGAASAGVAGAMSAADFRRWMRAKVQLVRKVRGRICAQRGTSLWHRNEWLALKRLVRLLQVAKRRACVAETMPWVRALDAAQAAAQCSVSDFERLALEFGHARVLHNAVGIVATSKGEKAKVVAGLRDTRYADHDSTYAQAYRHDETGKVELAPFPARPAVAYRKRRVAGLVSGEYVPQMARVDEFCQVQAALATMNARKASNPVDTIARQKANLAKVERTKLILEWQDGLDVSGITLYVCQL